MAQGNSDSSLEIIFGKRRAEQFWEITSDPEMAGFEPSE